MNAEFLTDKLQRYIPVRQDQVEFMLSLMNPIELNRKEFLLMAGNRCDYFSLVEQGVMMNYFSDENGEDHVLQFAVPMWWTADLYSLVHGSISSYSIQALTPARLLRISRADLELLYDEQPLFERYFRIIFQNALMAHQRRIIQGIAYSAEERYLKFQEDYPEWEQLIPQKYIASYLGMSAEFLSKVKKALSHK